MKKIFTLLVFTFLLNFNCSVFAQTNIHYWDFNSGATTTAGNKWPSPISAATTVGGGTLTHNFTNTDNFSGSTLDAPGFTTATSGTAFCVVDMANNNNAFVLNVPTTGFQNIKLTYATRGTSSGFSTHTIDYSLDGTTFVNMTTITGRTSTSFSLLTVDFSSVTGANNNPNFKIRITLTGATSATGNNRFDNIRISGLAAGSTTVSAAAGSDALEPATNGSFTINLTSPAPVGGVTVTYSLSGTATQGTDYNDAQSGTITITSGNSSGTVNINVIDDNVIEPTETITLTLLTAGNGYTVAGTPATISLFDNESVAAVIGRNYNFNNCSSFITDGFKQYSVTGAEVWSCSKFGRTYTVDPSSDSAIQMNGFSGTPQTNEDWFISPPYNLTGANYPQLKFYSRVAFTGNSLVLKVSTNYSGSGNPNLATWTDLNGKFPAVNSNVWTLSDSINLSAYTVPNVYLAWVYTSTTSSATRWTLDDIKLYIGCTASSNQPTSLVLNPSITSISGSFTPAVAGTTPSDGYLVIMSTSNTLNAQPQNGQVYAVDDVIGNGTVISANNNTTFTAGNLNPSTAYYFYIYSYSATQTCYNFTNPLTGNITTNSPPVCTPPSVQASNLTATGITGSSITLNYVRGNGDNIIIVSRMSTAVNQNPINGVSYAIGSQIGSGNFVIYNGPANTFNYTGLTQNTTYYFALYEYANTNTCYNASALTGNFTTSCTTPVNVSSLNAVAGNTTVNLTWSNPTASCFNEVLVIASNAPITGQGSDFPGPANTTYSGPNQVVYRSTGSAVTVTGLTNSTNYYFKIFTKNGSTWSGGVQINVTPYDPAGGFQYLFGNLHSHSSYSDGNKEDLSKKPIDDYKFARDANCMDFLGISEHNHSGAGMNVANYPLGYNDANAIDGVISPATGNSIVTLWGMEWGVISNGGHVCVYGFNDQLIGWEPGNYNIFCAKSDYTSLFSLINGQANAFATLAHPNYTDYGNLTGTAYNSSADNAIVGAAIESGPAFSTDTTYSNFPSRVAHLDYYNTMLAKGYHLGATMDGDNHYLTFGRQSANRMVVLSVTKTRADLINAIKEMRFYASNDCNVRVDFKCYSKNMGSSLVHAGSPTLTINVTDPDGESVDSIKIYGGKVGDPFSYIPVKAYAGTSSIMFDPTDPANLQPDNTTYYYYAIIKQVDSNRVITSPIWYTRNDAVLPIVLTDFKAIYLANKTSLLQWTTAQEFNSKVFIVERSTDGGRTFFSIGSVNARGSSVTTSQYQFTDLAPVTGTNLYRLKEVDIDNRFQYSNVVAVVVRSKEIKYYSLYPNPAQQVTYINSTSAQNKLITIQLVDATGKILANQTNYIDNNHPIKLDLNNISQGIYFVKISTDGNTKTERLIIK